MKKLSDLLKECTFSEIIGNRDIPISGISYDSRLCKKDYIFFALDGIHTNGQKFIDAAAENGATAVFVSKMPKHLRENVTYIKTDSLRKNMSSASCALYSDPSSRIKVIGVTGTDGKSSVVFYLFQLLNMLGEKTGFFSTVEYSDGDTTIKNPYRQSTPESSEIMKLLDKMAAHGCKYAALESTSHGLSEMTMRLADVKYKAGILTNISHEHLEFHGTLEKYADDKANLFRKSSLFNIVNMNDKFAPHFIEASGKVPVYKYSISDKNADIYAEDIVSDNTGSSFTVNFENKKERCRLNIPGIFNIENFLASAAAVIKITGAAPEKVFALGEKIKPVKGRMEVIDMGQPFALIVDYAHTPGAFKKLFPMIKKQTKNRLITMFGSAGERDTGKRAIQGDIASAYSDMIIITDEDPRGEKRTEIIKEIASGICDTFDKKNLYLIPDRREAVEKAIMLAEKDDTVLLLGKGHESTIIYENGPIPWDERSAAEEALRKRLSRADQNFK